VTFGNLTLIGAPTACTGRPGGLDRSPTVLRDLGVAEAIGASIDLNDLPIRIDTPERDTVSGVIGAASVERAIRRTRDAVERVLNSGSRALILGGCCTYIVGAMAAATRVHGRCGIIYVDGHLDLYDGRTSPTGECADMPMAAMLGKAGDLFTRAMGLEQAVSPADVALLAYRDYATARAEGSLLPEDFAPELFHHDAEVIRRTGPELIAQEVLRQQGDGARHSWLHLDWDVLDPAEFPAVDYLMPGGLSWNELEALVGPVIASDRLIGVSTACYNPDRDPGLSVGRQIVNFLRRVFTPDE
jgi:arginase